MSTSVKKSKRLSRFTAQFIAELAERLRAWCELPDSFWLGDFAVENKIARQRLSELAAKNEDFRDAYELAKTIQETKLFKMGLSKKYNPAMVIFALKNVAGWRDEQHLKTEIDQNISVVSKIPRPKLSDVAVAESGELEKVANVSTKN